MGRGSGFRAQGAAAGQGRLVRTALRRKYAAELRALGPEDRYSLGDLARWLLRQLGVWLDGPVGECRDLLDLALPERGRIIGGQGLVAALIADGLDLCPSLLELLERRARGTTSVGRQQMWDECLTEWRSRAATARREELRWLSVHIRLTHRRGEAVTPAECERALTELWFAGRLPADVASPTALSSEH